MDDFMIMVESERMCECFKKNGGCKFCPALYCCPFKINIDREKANSIVEQWNKEHPLKTRMQDFLEKYPNSLKEYDGSPTSCCKELGYCDSCYCDCLKCWNEPIEDYRRKHYENQDR